MNILLIGINFGDYEIRIREEMEAQGHKVDYIFDTTKHYSFFRRVLGEKATQRITRAYHTRVLRTLSHEYDEVIVIVGRQLTSEFIHAIKEKCNPKAFTLYLWDDVARVENYNQTKAEYDYIYSFDSEDCKRYGFIHLPLFYTKTLRDMKAEDLQFDVYSAMSNHSDRIQIAKKVIEETKNYNRRCRMIICLGRFNYLRALIKRKPLKGDIEYIAEPINKEENYKNMMRSKAVLDVQFSSQIGLTMRSIESLAFERKLITTNPLVKEYDFYNQNNILVIDRDNVYINDEFLDSEYEKIDKDVFDKYSISSWVDAIINKKHNRYLKY